MRSLLVVSTSLTSLLVAATLAGAQNRPDPVRLVPRQAELVLQVDNPARLLRTMYDIAPLRDLLKLPSVQEALQTTQSRRFFQLVQYFEKKLGRSHIEILDDVAGGGIVLATRLEENPPAMLIIQGRSEKAVRDFTAAVVDFVNDELDRQEAGIRFKAGEYQGFKGYSLANKVLIGVLGSAVVVTNNRDALKAAVRLYQGRGKGIAASRDFVRARSEAPKQALVWGWVGLTRIRKNQGLAQLFALPKLEPIFNVSSFGPMLDILGRSPYFTISAHREGSRFVYALQAPRGLKGMSKHSLAYFPSKNDLGALPLLEPRNVLASAAFQIDLGRAWKQRQYALKPEQVKEFEKLEKISGRFTAGVRLSDVLLQSGVDYRIVVAQPSGSIYKHRKPGEPIPAFAVVHRMRDPKLARTLETMIRTAALFGAFGLDLKLVEEKVGGVTLVTYRFPEKGRVKFDPNGIRFAFSPCFARVGNEFMVASTVELGRELVGLLQRQGTPKRSGATTRVKFYARGAAVLLDQARDAIVTQLVLAQGRAIDDAEKEVDALIDIVRRLGTAEAEVHYAPNSFKLQYTVDLQDSTGKNSAER